ncbi:MAG: NUDIX domain-containing protein [Patescibacteria group bacterium]
MTVQRVRGVALIVQNPEGKILVLQEHESKPHFGKYSGMFSIPMETSKPNESNYSTVVRLIGEELPGLDLPIDGVLKAYIGDYRIVSGVWVKLFLIKANNAYLPDSENSKNKEVGNYQWMNPEKALNLWLRQGAREMINDFMSNKKGVLCRYCCAPEQNK